MTSPLTGTIEEIGQGNAAQVFRLRKMIVLMAPETATVVTSIVDSTDGTTLSLPGDYKTVGYLDKSAGSTLTPGLKTSDSTVFGQVQPINQYVTETSFTADFTMSETHRPVLEAYYGMDLSAVKARAATKEITWDVPDQPEVRYVRMLIIGQHRDGADAIWMGYWLPKASIQNIGAQKIDDSNDFVYPVTYEALVDSAVGTSRRPFIAGPGLATLGVEPLGFTVG